MDNLKPPDLYTRSISTESDASNYTDAMSSMDDNDAGSQSEGEVLDCDFEYNSDDADLMLVSSNEEIVETMHPSLYRDLENLVFIYGENAVEYRLFESIDEIDIELHVPVSFLEEVIAEAWKVNRHEPLIIRLHFSLSRYIESSTCPRVEVFQTSKREAFGFGSQVRKFVESFLFKHWNSLNVEYQKHVEREEQLKRSSTFPITSRSDCASVESTSACSLVHDECVAKLVELGFDPMLARNALIITHGNLDEASNLILTNPATCADMPIDLLPQTAPMTPSVHNSETDIDLDNPLLHIDLDMDDHDENKSDSKKQQPPKKMNRQLSHPPVLSKLKRILPSRLMRTTSMMPGLETKRHIEDLNLMPLLTLDGTGAKNVPSLADGFLVQIFRYVRQRIPTMNEYCVICDEQHIFQNSAMLKPAVCTRELCVFAFQTLGVMADAAEDIATGAEVVDLLINMSKFACQSNRKNLIFDPFPTVVDPKDPTNLLFNPKNKKFDEVQAVLDAIPNMQEMAGAPAALKQKLNEKNPAVYPLIQWIITSNRSHIVKLPLEKQLDFMVTPHQFLLVSNPPAKEVAFQEAKKKHGSTFVFHGSSIENWHSIIRQGLLSASGTRLQVNGAAYGKGIYLSPNISTSMGYSRMGYSTHSVKKNAQRGAVNKIRFLNSNNITCIAICEVITSKDLKKNNSIWVCPDSNHVCTRFFFVYEDGQVSDSSVNTQDQKILEKINEACSQ